MYYGCQDYGAAKLDSLFPECADGVSLDSIPTPAMLVGEDGIVLSTNAAVRNLLGITGEELNARRVDDVLVSMDCIVAIASTKVAKHTQQIQLRGRRQADIEVSVGVDRLASDGKRYLLLLRDVSDDAEVRRERDRLLNIAGVGTALPALLHEIRTPLASITAAVELLLEEMADSVQREQIHAVLSEVRRMKLSLDGVLTVGRSLRSCRCAAVDQSCRHAWQIMSARARSLGIYSQCAVEDMPLLPLDPAVVGGIVHNLMINSIQACSAGQAVNLRAGLSDDGSRFNLTVVDNGSGMTAEVYNRCTEIFFTTKRNGSGIGLALCRRAVEESGGTLTIESVVGFGTSVTIEVPLAERDSATAIANAQFR
jgi:signal transduction histidine kinase